MKHLKLFFALFAMLALGVGNAWGAEAEVYSADFTSVETHSYTQNKTFTLNSKSWTSSVSQVQSKVFYLGCNSNNKDKGVLNDNSTFSEIVTALKSVDSKYSASVSTAHAYAMLFDNAYTNVTRVSFGWAGGNNAFQVYLFGYSNSSWSLLKQTNYATSGTAVAGSVEWTGEATDYTKFAVVARPGAANTTATNKTLRAKSFTIYTDDTPAGATKYMVTIDPNIENGTVKANPTEAAEGATVTLTATPAANYNFGSWTVKDASDADVAVTGNTFTMPASNVTVSASFVEKSKYTITWNVAEGSVAPTQIYEGNALGTLPTADNCSSGKVFIGWTEANSVNADGSGLVLAKANDVPAGNKEYNAVYANQEVGAGESGSADVVLADGVFDETNKKITWTTDGYATILQVKGTSQTDVANYTSEPRWYVGHNVTFTPQSGVNITTIVINQGAETKYQEFANATITNAEIVVDGQTVTLTPENGSNPVVIVPTKQLRPTAITIHKGAATSNSNYSLDCEANNEPFLTVTETPIDFGTIAQNETATETFDVTGGYLAEDVALTISGTDASFFSVNPTTIAKADEVNETVTVTYNPTEVGDHTATLTIKTDDITKEIALSGKVLAPGKWVLVKDIATLSAGDEIIIAAANADYAIGAAASNNYKGAAITKVGETANADAGVTVLKVEATGDAEVPYALKDGSKYLYAAGPSDNYLKAQATNNVNGQWAVTITEGVASIVAAKSSNRNVMQYNPNNGNPIFACYAPDKLQQPLAIYRNSENVVKPVISGDADFTGSTQVTITAQNGLTVYYTTNGSTPDKTATQYSAPFTISETTTVKAIAYDATDNASAVAEMTFTKHDLVNVATAMALAKDKIAYFDEFEVVKVVAGKGNIYIKDASGHGLIYDNTLAGELKDGDRVQRFVGVSSPYNGLPEAKPYNVTYEDLTITAGTAAEPYDFTSTVIAETDINKYIVFQNVEIATEVSISDSEKEFSLTIGGNSVKFYNQFGVSKTLEADKIYDIYGFVAVYEKDGNRTLQAYFYEAVQDGEVIQKYTVTYNAGGATGTVPEDNAEYSEGAEVYLKSATSLTYEGYDYKGWKVTDANGTEIPVASNKFNMPASNVTVTAQWEEIVVTPKKDFSEGYWVLVTEASELNADDYIVIAAAEEDLAMKSYESGNNCGQIGVTKANNLLTWNENVGVFQLLASGSNYTIQDVNTKQYLYAAGTGTSNHLKANNNIATDENASKYVWTVSFTDGVPTVKATSDNRNTLMYNTGSNLFSCYSSGQKDIALYKYVTELPTPTLTITDGDNSAVLEANNGQNVNVEVTREFTIGNLYTISLPFALNNVSDIFGNVAYEYSSLAKNSDDVVLYFSKVNTMEAGKPYLIEPTKDVHGFTVENVTLSNTTNNISFFVDATAVSMEAVLSASASATTEGKYWLASDKYLYNNSTTLKSLRALFTISTPSGIAPRVRVALEENGETGLENITDGKNTAIKVIENGQLVIIRNGEKFNAQGQKL